QEVKQAGFIRRLISSLSGSKEPANYEDPFADFDEKTMISQTDTSTIGLNVAVLCEMDGGMRICQIPITKDSFVLGRKRNEADYCFEGNTAADKGISRIHASIVFDGSDYYLTDKGSSGGTFLNENRLAPGQSAKIVHGDRIRLYQKELIFEHA
ncbi:MAG: FHA domain-containing protein, partial [Defluviitaleaceae bacterium]|nr:FHA domain-containing protein [Defluviitaleaceae bacterium]